MHLKLGEGLLQETFATVRACGHARRECVLYWAGPIREPSLVDRIIHPDHIGEPGYYEVEQHWLNQIWFRLRDEQIIIHMQVHTHGGPAFHSRLDDDYPFLQTAGFGSLVIPHYGFGDVSLTGTYLAELADTGTWRELDPHHSLEQSV